MKPFENLPTIFHFTHPKAGSQWVMQVLKECAPERFIQPRQRNAHFFEDEILTGRIYPTLYTNFEKAASVISSWQIMSRANARNTYFSDEIPRQPGIKRLTNPDYQVFLVIRDLRDTLISLYFSLKSSHPEINQTISKRRKILLELNKEDGLLYLMNEVSPMHERIQISWLDQPIRVFKYEDLVADEYRQFKQMIDHCEIKIEESQLVDIVNRNSFSTITGRKKGQEDRTSHQRKGIAGDWRNHFTEGMKKEFKSRFGNTLIKTGYEHDLDW